VYASDSAWSADEALSALNTDTLDSLQSWGGSRRWITMQRPG
jgi:hypothetical protein